MVKMLTKEELIQKLTNIQQNQIPMLAAKMGIAAAVVEGEAKRNCTPGQSPYEDMVFPTKIAASNARGSYRIKKVNRKNEQGSLISQHEAEISYSGAPYSNDLDKNRDLIHMRDTIYSGVDVDQNGVHGFVGTPKDYALYVHEGTSKMWGRPFITDAISAKEKAILRLLSEGVMENLEEQSE